MTSSWRVYILLAIVLLASVLVARLEPASEFVL